MCLRASQIRHCRKSNLCLHMPTDARTMGRNCMLSDFAVDVREIYRGECVPGSAGENSEMVRTKRPGSKGLMNSASIILGVVSARD